MTCHEYSQGICADGAAILKDGQPMTVEEIVAELKQGQAARAQGDEVEAVGVIELSDYIHLAGATASQRKALKEVRDGSIQNLSVGTKLYTHPPAPAQADDSVRGVPRCQQCGNLEPFHATGCKTVFGKYTEASAKGVPEGWLGIIKDAHRHLTNWMQLQDCDCEYGHTCGYTDVHNTAAALSDLLSTTPGNGWVRCEDRLPTEADGSVVWSHDEIRETVELVSWAWVSGLFKNGKITHWRPTGLKRPQPPKDNTQEGSRDD